MQLLPSQPFPGVSPALAVMAQHPAGVWQSILGDPQLPTTTPQPTAASLIFLPSASLSAHREQFLSVCLVGTHVAVLRAAGSGTSLPLFYRFFCSFCFGGWLFFVGFVLFVLPFSL